MAKSSNQKGKILYLERMFWECGSQGTLTMQEILTRLEEKGIRAERKSIYDNLETLRSFGMDIQYRRGKQGGYYLGDAYTVQGAGAEHFKTSDMEISEMQAEYASADFDAGEKRTFAPEKSGEADGRQIRLLCSNSVRNEVERYLGALENLKEKGSESFAVTATLNEDSSFYGWLASMGHDVRIVKPKKAAAAYRDYLKNLAKDYKGIDK